MAVTNSFDYGQLVRITYAVTSGGAPTDCTTVTVTVRTPAGVDTPYTLAGAQVVRDGVGQYHYDVNAVQAGTWEYTWTTTGPQSAFHGYFFIRDAML